MKSEIAIQGRPIGPEHPPYVIAEMSGNHNQSLERALAIVDAAARTGADAVKLQTYTPDTMTIDLGEDEFFIDDPKSLWKGESLYHLYAKAHTPWEWHAPLMDRCRQHGMHCFSTPFDATAVDFLESLGVGAYKIASFELVDLPLIRRVAATGKPIIMSTGMATVSEIEDAVTTAQEGGCDEAILLKCTSAYPSDPAESHLRTIPHLRDLFDLPVGISDHTPGIGAALVAVALGAVVIEKHFTLRRADGGVDSAFSLEPDEMEQLVTEARLAQKSLGQVHYGLTAQEEQSRVFRRSIYVVEDVEPGEMLSERTIRIIRPGLGLPPKYFDQVLGMRAPRRIARGTPMSWDLLGGTVDEPAASAVR